jgi:hypothetical protein
MKPARKSAPVCIGVAVAMAVAGCGGASSTPTTTTASTTAPAASQGSTAPSAAPVTHLAVVSPHPGAHTGSTLTVHVTARGAPSGFSGQFRYVLDGRVTRSGSSELTFHDLAPGHHTVRVVMVGSPVETSTSFTVSAPAPA